MLIPLQAGHLLGLHGFPKGIAAILKGHHSAELTLEVAWLLALISAGPEAHMHALVKHGGAEAVASALSSAIDDPVGLMECMTGSDQMLEKRHNAELVLGVS